MALPQDCKKLNEFNSDFRANGYKLHVQTIEYHWNNGGSKMEDMPGDFLDVEVRIIGTSRKLSPLEALAVEKQVVLHKDHKEITHEPEGYAKLWHDNIVKRIQEQPTVYLQNIADAIKKAL